MIYTPLMPDKDCPFCNIPDDRIVASNDLALAIYDNFPVSPGHMLFIPRRHVSSWFDATEEEQIAIFKLINQFQRSSDTPRGYETRGQKCAFGERGSAPGRTEFRRGGEDTPRETPSDCLNHQKNISPQKGVTDYFPPPPPPRGMSSESRGLSEVRQSAEARQSADACQSADDSQQAYNIGINIGPPAGQTVMHLHVHLIPRYEGDTDDPRGGVRWVLPGKAKYWE